MTDERYIHKPNGGENVISSRKRQYFGQKSKVRTGVAFDSCMTSSRALAV